MTADLPTSETDAGPDLRDGLFGRRVARTSWILILVGAFTLLILRQSVPAAVSLTAAGGVAIINFRWLEAILLRVLQPGKPQFDGRSVLRIIGRLALFAGIFAALLLVPGIDFIAVALGFSTLVVAVIFEGLRWGAVGGG
jgi:hypothetical protein